MFNVIRNIDAPECLSRNVYNDPSVVDALRSIFFDKCYLCEQSKLSDPEIEHFIPHEGRSELKYAWGNLFYSCSRCNSIKSNVHVGLLDCSSGHIDVFNEIKHSAGNAAIGKIDIEATNPEPSQAVKNTVNLLMQCFNSENTGLRGVTKEALMEKIVADFLYFMSLRTILVDQRSTDSEMEIAIDKLIPMCRVSYPFSVFWKWHIVSDNVLISRYPELRFRLNF